MRRWANDPNGRPQARHAQRLDGVRHLVAMFEDSLPGEQTGRWLRARNRNLGGERPLALLATNRYDDILKAARIFDSGHLT